MNVLPKVSICIPTYKQPASLKNCLDSIKKQSYKNFEVIITDDSQDNSVSDVVDKYIGDFPIKYFKNKRQLGSPRNWNESINKASGEYIKIIHHDDWLSRNDSLEKYVNMLDNNPGVDFAFSASNAYKNNMKSYIHATSKKQLESLKVNTKSLLYGNFIGAPSAIIHRKSKIRYDEKLKWLVDVDYYYRLLMNNNKFTYCDEPLISITTDGKNQISRTCENNKDVELSENLYLFNKINKPGRYSLSDIKYLHALFTRYKIYSPADIKKYYINQNVPFYIKLVIILFKYHPVEIMKRVNIFLTRNVNRIAEKKNKNKAKKSYAQCGEDIIIKHIFSYLNIVNPTYLDIGAHHPTYLSNTYLLYLDGGTGVCIEPDPTLYKNIVKVRPNDICLDIGITTSKNKTAKFYVMNEKSLNTFSYSEAKRFEKYGNKKITKILKISVKSINEIIRKYFKKTPNLISIDIEGLDLSVLKSLNYKLYRPEVIIAETLTYSEDNKETKIKEISDFVESMGYFIYADTYINTIFVEKKSWNNRK